MRVGVLASGSGTNVQAILDAERAGRLGPAKVVVVIANVSDAGALERARAVGVPAELVEHNAYPTRATFDAALSSMLRRYDVELVALAGFMRILTPAFLSAFPERVVNVHPSLLPAFPGVHAQKQALDYGARVAGCTVHFVDDGLDSGPIISQAAVTVADGDDLPQLTARILAEEHRLYPAAICAIAEGRVQIVGRRVKIRS